MQKYKNHIKGICQRMQNWEQFSISIEGYETSDSIESKDELNITSFVNNK